MTKMRYEFIQPKRQTAEPYSKVALVELTRKYWREIRKNIIPPELQKFLDDNNLPVRLLEPTTTKPVDTGWLQRKSPKNQAKILKKQLQRAQYEARKNNKTQQKDK